MGAYALAPAPAHPAARCLGLVILRQNGPLGSVGAAAAPSRLSLEPLYLTRAAIAAQAGAVVSFPMGLRADGPHRRTRTDRAQWAWFQARTVFRFVAAAPSVGCACIHPA